MIHLHDKLFGSLKCPTFSLVGSFQILIYITLYGYYYNDQLKSMIIRTILTTE